MRLSLLIILAVALGGCQLPPINLATSEPIKVDINVRLDVYQHTGAEPHEPSTSSSASGPSGASTRPLTREERALEIQQFKNSRLVGEGHSGLVVIRGETRGDYGAHVRRVVSAENADRNEMMKKMADKEKRSLPQIREDQAKLWRNRSFKGEWIEVPQGDGAFKWLQKEG